MTTVTIKTTYRDIVIKLGPYWGGGYGYKLPQYGFSSGPYDTQLEAKVDAKKRIDGYWRSGGTSI